MNLFDKTFWRQGVLFSAILVFALGGVLYAGYSSQQEVRENALREMDASYSKDIAGGSTPEETLNLFISALEKQDSSKAATYFLPEKQALMKEHFDQGKENGGMVTFAHILRSPKKGVELFPGSYEYQFNIGEDAPLVLSLVHNDTSKVWKLEAF